MAKSLVSCFFDSQCRIFNSTTVQTIRLGSIGRQYVTNSAVFSTYLALLVKSKKWYNVKVAKSWGSLFGPPCNNYNNVRKLNFLAEK